MGGKTFQDIFQLRTVKEEHILLKRVQLFSVLRTISIYLSISISYKIERSVGDLR